MYFLAPIKENKSGLRPDQSEVEKYTVKFGHRHILLRFVFFDYEDFYSSMELMENALAIGTIHQRSRKFFDKCQLDHGDDPFTYTNLT